MAVVIKWYTDIEQSKNLEGILPIESANMAYFYNDKNELLYPTPFVVNDRDGYFLKTYCWSLAALLNILPSSTLDSSDNHHYRLHCMERFSEWHSNSIYACCEMILKLNELNLL